MRCEIQIGVKPSLEVVGQAVAHLVKGVLDGCKVGRRSVLGR